MRWTKPARAVLLAILLPTLATPILAQDREEGGAAGYSAIIDNIDLLVDNYARFLARKYDLTEEQDEYTKSLLRERSQQFLDQNEEVLRDAIDRMFEVRSGGDMSPEELIEWGRSVQPVYEQAKKVILEGNNDWREILTPEQKTIHDEDVRLMEESFTTTEDQLTRILSGEMTVEEFRSPQKNSRRSRTSRGAATPRAADPQPATDDGSPEPRVSKLPPTGNVASPAESPRRLNPSHRERGPEDADERAAPSTPSAGESGAKRTTRPEPNRRPRIDRPGGASKSSAGSDYESKWEKYVQEFIAKYELNDEQTQKANAVLEDCKAQAVRYLSSRKSQFEMIDKQLETLKQSKDKNKSKMTSELTKKRGELMTPIDQIFEKQLKPRLENLPTRAQRRAAEVNAKKKPPAKPEPAAKPAPPAQDKPEEPETEDDD